MALKEVVLTEPTFANGTLLPAGARTVLDIVDIEAEPAPGQINGGEIDRGDGRKVSNTPNLGEPGTAPVLVPTAVSAIGPTGPNPRIPQQVPPGALQLSDGTYALGGAQLVAEGHPELQAMTDAANEANDGVEEEAVQRLNLTAQDAGTAASNGPGDVRGTNGTETGATGTAAPFSADTYTGSTVDAVDFSGLDAAQLQQVRDAEVAGAARATFLAKLDAAAAALTA